MKKMVFIRRISQIFFLFVFIYILWSTTYPLKGLLPAGTFFKIDPLVMIFTSISERILIGGFLFSIGMVLLTFLFGRFFCGWICPLGTIIDAVGIKNKKRMARDRPSKKMRWIKFIILLGVTLFAFLGIQVAWVFDPIVIMARFVSLNLIPAVTFLISQSFIFLIRNLNMRGMVPDVYNYLASSLLGIKVHYFSHSIIILLILILVCALSWRVRRYWCRVVCPLGALYALSARLSWLRRIVGEGCTQCTLCKKQCRMGAINEDLSYNVGECILCMDCIYDCPARVTQFRFLLPQPKRTKISHITGNKSNLTRRQFLFLVCVWLLSIGTRWRQRKPNQRQEDRVIRPPAALKEDEFLNRCIRCGNCMKVCITNGLQPALLQTGFEGIWTPILVPEIGYCEYQCTLCGNVCPTGAIPRLTLAQKIETRLGLAEIDRSICLPWSEGKECIVCEEHCPVAYKAIKLKKEVSNGEALFKPYVNEELCVGCGICQNKCPVRPVRAIKVSPQNSDRT